MRLGVIGAGRIGSIHIANASRHPSVSDLVITDISTQQASLLATQHGALTAPTPDAVFSEVDAVVIATPADTHVDLISEAVARGVPVLCEKPLALSLSEADRAVRIVGDSDIPVQMGFNRRFDPGYREARQKIANGSMGTVTLVVGHHHDHDLPSKETTVHSGGQFRDQLIHDFDLLRFITGQEATRVHAAGTTAGFDWFGQFGDFAHSVVTLWLEEGALAVLCGSRFDPLGYDVRTEIFGTGDSIAVGWDDRTPLRSVEPGGPRSDDPYTGWLPRFGATYQAELDAFLGLVAGSGNNECTVEDARAALVIAEACALSAIQGRIVELSEVA